MEVLKKKKMLQQSHYLIQESQEYMSEWKGIMCLRTTNLFFHILMLFLMLKGIYFTYISK